jgi:general secretion pathway protein K
MAISNPRRGSALLTVLWISAALAAVGFALANTVRGETERTSTTVDDMRSYYLAAGAVERAAIEVLWSANMQTEPKLPKGTTRVDYEFGSGMAHVEIVPETAKLDVNRIGPDRLARMLEYMGAPREQLMAVVEGVMAWRAGKSLSVSSLSGPTFPGAGTSFQEIEEMLVLKGVTPELFYGTYVPAPENRAPDQPRLIRRSGLNDCLSVFGSSTQVDANTADPAVLFALGMPDSGIEALLAQRRITPLDPRKLNEMMPLFGQAGPFLRLEGHSIVTIRATGRIRLPSGQLSDLKRSVAAMVKYMPRGYDSPIHILRWYDTAWSD